MRSSHLFDQLHALQPAAASELKNIESMSEAVTDPALLDLCSGYTEAALACRDWQPPAGGLSEREQAFIDFTEQFVTSVSTLGHAAVNRLLDFATADEVYAFVHALYVRDMSLRLEMVGREVLS